MQKVHLDIRRARIENLKQRLLSTKPEICSERARIITTSYQETEDEPMILRRAKALDKMLREMSVYILDDELIVGHPASKPRSVEVFPEFGVSWIEEELDQFEVREQDRYVVPEKVKQELRQIFPYWQGKGVEDRVFASLPDEVKKARFQSEVFALTAHEATGLGHVILDYEKVLKKGFKGIKREVEEKFEKLDLGDSEAIEKYWFYKALMIVLNAAIAFAKRYSQEAERLIETETVPERKKELEAIVKTCEKVPSDPAETFYEALQSFWFTQLIPQIETNASSVSPGRFDQYMYPYYRKDIDEGIITRDNALELLECLWIKFSEPIILYNTDTVKYWAGYPQGQVLTIGGQTKEGKDATNELSYMCLEAQADVGLGQPNLGVRIHRNTPGNFLNKVCEVIRLGSGMPQLFFDETYVPSLLRRGIPLEEALDYGNHGCTEGSTVATWGRTNGGTFNLAKCLELALNNGVCRLTKRQVGPRTGDPAIFISLDDIIEAFKKQVAYFAKHLIMENNLIDLVHAELVPVPFVSTVKPNCIEKGLDATRGGARYNWTGGPSAVGTTNVGDSLAAIRKVVFEDKKVSLSELNDVLNEDFEENEVLRQELLNKIPKYGNDNSYVDELVKKAMEIFIGEVEKYRNPRSGKFYTTFIPVSSYVHLGSRTGATPDGRKAKEPLADGISPSNGAERFGPTAAMKSIASLYPVVINTVGIQINMKFHPVTMESKEGMGKFADLIRVYDQLGGMHIQFNVVSADTLKAAQKNPEQYRGLVVRVAGYSALFTELDREIQNSIIARTEHQFQV